MPRIPRFAWYALPLAAAAVVGASLGILVALSQDLPQVEALQTFEPSAITTLVAADGTPLRSFYLERRVPVPLDAVPADLVRAIIAVEDARFYQHFGIDLKGIGRALWRDLKSLRVVEGGSTLTQQLAKVLFLTPDRTLSRKLKEALLAVNIERRYSKEEILAFYLNQIYLGEGAYGVEAASRTYFGRSVSELTLSQCALLAGLPRSPSRYSPFAHPERAEARRVVVLRRLMEEGYLSEEAYLQARAAPVDLTPSVSPEDPAPYFTEMVRGELEDLLGANLLYRGGLTVETTLDPALQAAAVRAVENGLAAYEARRPRPAGSEPLQAALAAVDTANGGIRAMVGGRDFAASPFNRAVQARRQPGSAFKPVLYAAALASGFTPSDRLRDEPFEVRLPGQRAPYVPANYTGGYQGEVTLRVALERSLNAASVDLLLRLGYQPVLDTARRLGFTSDLKPYPSLALGAFDVSLLETVSAFAAMENAGVLCRPHAVRRVTDRDGRVLLEAVPECTEALSPQTAFQITNLLEGVVERGTAQRARSLGRPAAGKTGTTDGFRDAWFVGFLPGLAAGVWVGYDTPRSLGSGEAGAVAALPIWIAAMEGVEGVRKPFPAAEGIELVEVDPVSGLLALPACPERVVEAFLPGTAPAEPCPIHGP